MICLPREMRERALNSDEAGCSTAGAGNSGGILLGIPTCPLVKVDDVFNGGVALWPEPAHPLNTSTPHAPPGFEPPFA